MFYLHRNIYIHRLKLVKKNTKINKIKCIIDVNKSPKSKNVFLVTLNEQNECKNNVSISLKYSIFDKTGKKGVRQPLQAKI